MLNNQLFIINFPLLVIHYFMDDLDKAIKQSGVPSSKVAQTAKSPLGSLGKSITTSIVRNVVGILTRAVMKSLMGSGKKGKARSAY